MAEAAATIEIPPYAAGPARLVTARSYMIDRFVPDCEIVALPGKTVAGGQLRWRRGALRLPPPAPQGRLGRLRRRFRPPKPQRVAGRALFDLRHHDPQNWAHFLNNHLPLVARLCAAAGVEAAEALLVLPADAPRHLVEAARLFGFETLTAAGAVTGEGIEFAVEPWTAVRAVRADWARLPQMAAGAEAAAASAPPTPVRAFLARRGTRAIANMAEIEPWLAARGFATVYPEDLTAAAQIQLFREAETIVAIHGAALGPLLFVPSDGRRRRLVELLPVGHMTDVYRVMAEQVGVDWIGVRGRLKPAHVVPAYRLGERFAAFSLESFEVDLAALELAFSLIGEAA